MWERARSRRRTGKGAGRDVRTRCAGGRGLVGRGKQSLKCECGSRGPGGKGRHDEHRPVARELPVRLLAERDGGAHLRLLHHHRLQRQERPSAAARLADHAVSAAGRPAPPGAVCAVPEGFAAGRPLRGRASRGPLDPSPARSSPEWPGSALPFLPVLHVPHPPGPMREQHNSTPTPALPPGASPPASARGDPSQSPVPPGLGVHPGASVGGSGVTSSPSWFSLTVPEDVCLSLVDTLLGSCCLEVRMCRMHRGGLNIPVSCYF